MEIDEFRRFSTRTAVCNHFPCFACCDAFIEIRKSITAALHLAFDPNSYPCTNGNRIQLTLRDVWQNVCTIEIDEVYQVFGMGSRIKPLPSFCML